MITSGFYDSVQKDRLYNADDFSAMMNGIITDGVIMHIGDKFIVKEIANSMNVLIGTGRGWFNDKWIYNDSTFPLTISPAENALNRIDSIFIEINKTADGRIGSIVYVKGTPSEQPVRPEPILTNGIYQYRIADIKVDKQITSITQTNITNSVGTSDTPFVTGVVQNMNVDELLLQWDGEITELLHTKDTEINDWFVNMQGQISSDAAVNLQLQINTINEALGGRKILVVTEYPENPDEQTIYFKIEAEV